jgi:hypothetical protein
MARPEIKQTLAILQEAREVINRRIINGELYKVYMSDSEALSPNVRAKRRTALLKKIGMIITKLSLHSCCLTITFRTNSHHQRTPAVQDWNITPKRLQVDERLRFSRVNQLIRI